MPWKHSWTHQHEPEVIEAFLLALEAHFDSVIATLVGRTLRRTCA